MSTLSQTSRDLSCSSDAWLRSSDLMHHANHYVLEHGFITHDEVAHELGHLVWRVWEFDSLDDLLPLRSTWNRLANETPGATHFLTYDWLAAYWKHNSADQKLRILIIATENTNHLQNQTSNNGTANDISPSATIVGIVPLVLRNEKTRLGNVRVLTFPLHGWGSTYSPIGSCVDQTLYKAFEYLATQKLDYDLLDLRWIDNRQGLGDLTTMALHSQDISARRGVWHETSQIDLSSGWESYWASRSSHWRTNVRSNLKKLKHAGNVEYIRYRPSASLKLLTSNQLASNQINDASQSDPRWDLYEMCETVAVKSWQGERTDGTTISHAQVRDYLRTAHQSAIQCGAADINLLLIDSKPVAFAYNYAQFGSVYGLRAGYDPEWKKLGVGSVLMHHMLRDSTERGDRLFDLGPGNIPSKEPWLTEVVPCYRYTHYSPWSLKAWVLRLKHSVNQK